MPLGFRKPFGQKRHASSFSLPVMNSGLGYFFLESHPELRENHFMGVGLQNSETRKPAKQQTEVREEKDVKE
jgi:hypothetical protein